TVSLAARLSADTRFPPPGSAPIRPPRARPVGGERPAPPGSLRWRRRRSWRRSRCWRAPGRRGGRGGDIDVSRDIRVWNDGNLRRVGSPADHALLQTPQGVLQGADEQVHVVVVWSVQSDVAGISDVGKGSEYQLV